MFTDMQDWTDIRRQMLVQGASKRSVCRKYGIAHKPLQKILTHSEPPGYRQQLPRRKTRLEPYLATIEEILAADREVPRKQHHSARRIFERLRDEHGYEGGITQVKEAVARLRRHSAEVFVPLAHEPGRAQFDFGEATVRIAGEPCKAHFALMSLPYSDAFFMRAYPRECTETFQDAHAAAFAFFGGVPRKTDYDNSKIAVARIVSAPARAHARVPAPRGPLPLYASLLPRRAWQREGSRRVPGRLRAAQLHGAGAGLRRLG